MLARFFSLLLFLVFAKKADAQNNDAQNLMKDATTIMYSDPDTAIETAQYIVSSFGTTEYAYNALLLQAEIYLNLRKYNNAVAKLIAANRISLGIDNDFLKSKNEYLIAKIYLELGFSDDYIFAINDLKKNSESLKSEERHCTDLWENELEILILYNQGKYKECLSKIKENIQERSDLDPIFGSRLLIIKSTIENKVVGDPGHSNVYFQFLSEIINLRTKINKGEFLDSDLVKIKTKYPLYDDIFYIDIYRDLSKKTCGGNSAECFSKRSEYIRLLKKSISNKHNARINFINFINQKENSKIGKQIESHHKILFLLAAGTFLFLLIALIYYYIVRSKFNLANVEFEALNITKEYEQKLSDQQKDLKESLVYTISEKTENQLLSSLESFEKSKDVRDPNLSLLALAKLLNTNTTYMSEVINKHKGKNFNNYINELRINYIVEKLIQNPEYRQQKSSFLAEKSGFTSRTTFSTIFKSVTGKSPTQFINELKDK